MATTTTPALAQDLKNLRMPGTIAAVLRVDGGYRADPISRLAG